MRIAIHQPNYLPWPGYFKKMSMCDVFVFLDDVEISKKGYTRRVRIRDAADRDTYSWLTVPLMKHSDHAKINELRVSRRQDWILRHQNLIRQAYLQAPGWNQRGNWITGLLDQCAAYDSLADLNIFLVQQIAVKLGIGCRFLRSDEIPVSGKADSYTYALVKELGGTTYIRGMGEQRYARSPEWGSDPGLSILNIDYGNELNEDKTGTWRNGYSIIDLLLMSAQSPESYFG